jgi:hypothetical protein
MASKKEVKLELREWDFVLRKLNDCERVKKDIIKQLEKKPIKISSRKAKGRELQKWVCAQISALIGIDYKQADDECLIHSREMGQSGCDIILREEAKALFPFSIECKATEQISLPAFISQAKANTKEGERSMVVVKNKTLKEPVVILGWDDFAHFHKRFVDYMRPILGLGRIKVKSEKQREE